MMFSKATALCATAAIALAFVALPSRAGVITNAGTASTSNKSVSTTTSGQKSILTNIDPYNVASFQLDFTYEPDRAQFMGIVGLNGYIVDDFTVDTMGNIMDIHGYFPGFNDRGGIEGESEAGVPAAPPAGEIDIFQLLFLDLRPDLDKHFNVFAGGPDDYLRGFDPATGGFTLAAGPFNPNTGQGVQPSSSIIPGIAGPGGGPNGVPLPPALIMGLIAGSGVLANRLRKPRAA
jgi:hypothetical protein